MTSAYTKIIDQECAWGDISPEELKGGNRRRSVSMLRVKIAKRGLGGDEGDIVEFIHFREAMGADLFSCHCVIKQHNHSFQRMR